MRSLREGSVKRLRDFIDNVLLASGRAGRYRAPEAIWNQWLKWGGGGSAHLLSVCPPPPNPAKISALAAKNLAWPGLHCMRAVVLFVFCYHNIVTGMVNVVHTPSLHHRLRLCVYILYVCVSLNTNWLSIICIFICAPCFYRVATAIRHFMTDSRCICLIHLCKVMFLNFAPPPAFKSNFNHCLKLKFWPKISDGSVHFSVVPLQVRWYHRNSAVNAVSLALHS